MMAIASCRLTLFPAAIAGGAYLAEIRTHLEWVYSQNVVGVMPEMI